MKCSNDVGKTKTALSSRGYAQLHLHFQCHGDCDKMLLLNQEDFNLQEYVSKFVCKAGSKRLPSLQDNKFRF